MLRLISFLCLSMTLALPVHAKDAARDQVTQYKLDNGMDVLVIEDHRAPVVVHMVWYRAGSADETAGNSGIAHFLEHLMFKGTDTVGSGEFSKIVTKNGGRDNAFTSYDYTAYFQRIAADRLDLVMGMEADRMVNARITPKDVETERKVIIEERNQTMESRPSRLFREQKNALMYQNHRYGISVLGWKHEMEQLSLDDAMTFYKRFYAPNNAVLVVAGDVQPADVLALAKKHYGPIKANPDIKPRERTREGPQRAARRLVMRDARVGEPYVSRSYLAPERDSGAQDKAAALTLLSELMGVGNTSYLHEKLIFEQKKAVYVSTYYDGMSLDDTTFSVFAVPAPGVSLRELEDALDKTITGFMTDKIDPAALQRIKTQFRAGQIYARDDVEGLANTYGAALSLGLTVADVQNWVSVIEAVTPDQIKSAAREVLRPERSVTGWLMGEEEKK